MAIIKRNSKKGARYMARFMSGGIRYSKTFETLRAAKKWEANFDTDKKIAHKGSYFTVKDAWSEFIKERVPTRANSTIRDYHATMKYCVEFFKDKMVDEITRSDCTRFRDSLSKKGLHPRTVNSHINLLKALFNSLLSKEEIEKTPLHKFEALPLQKDEHVYWSVDEVNEFKEKSKGWEHRDIILFALNTGMRLGEIAALTNRSIDLNNELIRVDKSLSRGELKRTKTGEMRFLPINKSLKDIIKRADKNGYLFTVNNQPIQTNRFCSRTFKPFLVKNNIPLIRFHDLRHTFASHFMMNGGDVFTLKKLLGHKDIASTMIYAHLSKDYLKKAGEIVGF
jgi:site-specific recombinase XerD